jgi:hypothetical protein
MKIRSGLVATKMKRHHFLPKSVLEKLEEFLSGPICEAAAGKKAPPLCRIDNMAVGRGYIERCPNVSTKKAGRTASAPRLAFRSSVALLFSYL